MNSDVSERSTDSPSSDVNVHKTSSQESSSEDEMNNSSSVDDSNYVNDSDSADTESSNDMNSDTADSEESQIGSDHRRRNGLTYRERREYMPTGRCFQCGEHGHIARYCPENNSDTSSDEDLNNSSDSTDNESESDGLENYSDDSEGTALTFGMMHFILDDDDESDKKNTESKDDDPNLTSENNHFVLHDPREQRKEGGSTHSDFEFCNEPLTYCADNEPERSSIAFTRLMIDDTSKQSWTALYIDATLPRVHADFSAVRQSENLTFGALFVFGRRNGGREQTAFTTYDFNDVLAPLHIVLLHDNLANPTPRHNTIPFPIQTLEPPSLLPYQSQTLEHLSVDPLERILGPIRNRKFAEEKGKQKLVVVEEGSIAKTAPSKHTLSSIQPSYSTTSLVDPDSDSCFIPLEPMTPASEKNIIHQPTRTSFTTFTTLPIRSLRNPFEISIPFATPGDATAVDKIVAGKVSGIDDRVQRRFYTDLDRFCMAGEFDALNNRLEDRREHPTERVSWMQKKKKKIIA
ncbi:hypothetical protein D9757_015414 [Collybiopsis confluens]|uniref:CCHC-type domain-containing protein n=1 Tax=Collybiopsis confluens TaxID=2823264 RepID=A0A8H5G8I3_9AGAR|nr:hypothetical protein D9757_015414 [Collybiopsis confluens]